MEEGTLSGQYRDLIAWQKAMDLVEIVYALTSDWPKEGPDGLTSEVRRAVVAVPSNIAAGQGRASINEFLYHLGIARDSLVAVETQVLIAQRLGYLTPAVAERVLATAAETGRVISGLTRSLADRDH